MGGISCRGDAVDASGRIKAGLHGRSLMLSAHAALRSRTVTLTAEPGEKFAEDACGTIRGGIDPGDGWSGAP